MLNLPANLSFSRVTETFRLVVCAAAVLAACAAPAQDESAAEDAPPQNSFVESLKSGLSLIYKDPETGKPVVLPESYSEMLKEVERRMLLQETARLFELHRLDIEGSVEEDIVRLDVSLEIEVNQKDEWVEVPVGFDDFQLTDLQHTAEAEDGRAQLDKKQLPRKIWVLYGQGTHHLKLSLIGAARGSQTGRRRLKLGAPTATISRLMLTLTDPVEFPQLSSEQPLKVHTDSKTGQLSVEAWGLSGTTELTWTPKVDGDDKDVTIQATAPATMNLDLTTASLAIRQPLSIAGGSASRLNVKLPQGFGSISVSGQSADGEEIVKPTESSAGGDFVIEFTAPVTGAIVLQYDISLKNTQYPQEFAVRLPDFDNVSNESGDLTISAPIGLEVEIERPDARDVRQKRVESPGGSQTAVFGYRLLSAKSVLRMTVRETEAFYSVAPQISIEPERNNILLTARFTINMVSGSLNEAKIVWPRSAEDGWEILDQNTHLIQGESEYPLFASPDEADGYTISFPQRMSGQFVVELQALRPRNSIPDGDSFSGFLPDITSPTPHTTIVSLIESDEYSMVLTAQDGQSTFPILPSSRWPDDLKNRQVPLTARLVDSPEKAVSIKITPQRPEVKVDLNTELSIVHESIHVRQTMTFNVRHKDLLKITLSVPDVNPTVHLDGSPDPLEKLSIKGDDVEYSLPGRLRGSFDLTIDYYWSPQDSPEQPGRLPLVLPSAVDSELVSTTIGTDAPESLVLRRSSDWSRVHSDEYSAAWQCSERRQHVAVDLKHSLNQSAGSRPRCIVVKSAVRGADLVTSITGVFSRPVEKVLFSVPESVSPLEGFVGRHPAAADQVADDSETRKVIQLRALPEAPSEDALTATLVLQQPVGRQSQLLSVWKPLIPGIIGADRDCNVIWVVSQTADSSVMYWGDIMSETGGSPNLGPFSSSRDAQTEIAAALAPYDRQVRDIVLQLIQDSVDEPDRSQVLAGPLYRDNPVIVSVSRRGTLLIAAVVGLLIYFAFLKLRALSLLTTVAVLTAGSVAAAAVAPGPGQLILLRLIPGCAIAFAAAMLQRLFGRSASAPPMTGSDYDESTIFAIETPALTHDSPTVAGRSATVVPPSSHASVS